MSTINPKSSQRAAQLALSTFPQYKGIRVDIDADGKLLYVDPVTGTSSNDRDVVTNHRQTLGLVDYRLFNPGVGGNPLRDIGTSQGALQLESEVAVVNRFLRNASTDPIQAQRLRNLGLGRMIGQEVTGEFYKFNTRGQQGVIRQAQLLAAERGAAASSQTDEGFTFLTLKAKNTALSAIDASRLRIISGAEQIRPEFLATLAEETIDPITGQASQNWSRIGKLAKRLQSTMSPRNVAIGEDFIQKHLDITRPGAMTPFGRMPGSKITFDQRMLRVESTAARFELMFRDPTKGIPIRESDGLVLTPQQLSQYGESIVGFEHIPDYKLTQAERQFMLAGSGEGDRAQGKTGFDSTKELLDRRLTIRRNREMQSFKDLYGFDDKQIAKIQTAFDQANMELDDVNSPLDISTVGMTRAEQQFKRMKDIIQKTDNDLFKKMEIAINGMEKARDGQFYITPALLDDMKKAFKSQLDAREAELRRGGRVLTLDESNEIKALEKQIEHIEEAKRKIDSGDVIARVNGEFGQFKGEAMVLGREQAERFRDPETGLIPYVIGDATAIKGEVGSRAARNFLMDVGDTSTVTFSDPLMMLYHQDYFTQPAMIESMKINASHGFDKMQEFMKNGNVPEEVMKALRQDLEGDIKTIEAFMLDPQTRMSHLRKKREAEEIMAQMASGIRVNQIPAMVRRVSDHFSSQVVRYKNGRVDVVMPTAGRFSLRTFESRLVNAEDFMSYQGYDINLADYGVDNSVMTPFGRMPGETKRITTAGFRIKDKTLMMSGNAAYLYQHALGGFDLDDKGIPLMSTFKDAKGNKRLAFFTLRQPTSYQEYIAMSADLSDSSTVNALFGENDKFKAALQDDTVLSALGIRKDDLTYQQLSRMVNENGSVKRDNVNKDEIEQMILKILESGNVYPGNLPSLTDSQVVRMAMMQNPAALGLDRMVKDSSGNLTSLGNFMQSIGIDPSKSPAPYDSDSVFQIFQKAAEKDYNTELIRRAPQELGFSITDSEHIRQILKKTGPGYKPEDDIKLFALMKKMTEEIMAESANAEVSESIGVFANRQGVSVSVLEQSKKILTEELKISASDPLYEKFLEMTSVMTLPASEAVDIAKQIGADQVMYSFGPALQMIQETQGIKASTVDTVLEAYMQSFKNPLSSPFAKGMTPKELDELVIPMKLDPMGQSFLRAFSGIGYIRGTQIAEQITQYGSINEEELFGLQQTMFGEEPYSRIKGSDISIVKTEITRGLQAAMDELPDGPAKDAIKASLDAMSAESNALESLAPMFMKRGTAAYDKYAHTDQLIYALFDIHSASEAIKSQSVSSARLVARDLSPTSYARYQDTVEKILGSVSTNLSDIQTQSQKIMRGTQEVDPLGVKILRNETLTTIHGHVSAALEAERVAGRPTKTDDVLDLMETLTAGLESRGVQAGKLLTSAVTTGEEGDPGVSTMLDLFAAMRNRKIARSSMARTDMRAVLAAQDAYGSVGELRAKAEEILGENLGLSTGLPAGSMSGVSVPISTDLAQMTTDEAQAIIDAGRKIRKSGKRDLTDAEKIIGDFAGRVKALAEGKDIADRVDSPEARNAFMYHVAGRRVLEEADQRASEAVTGFLAGDQIPTAARDAIATSIDSARTTFSSGAVYKRFTDSLKTGALGDALKNKGVRRGLAAAGALAVFGFVKSHRRDHSPDDAAGPPLLPGGSAYESGYPTRQAVIENLRTINPLTRGMQYKVYTSGSSEDAEKLRSMVGGVTDGEVNSTMYSSLPLLGQDPYSQVASQF